jgi:glycosyltransferase involved in cell wall biosynthesis
MNKISIITAVYNAEDTLETLIKSIAAQELAPYEFLIVDGFSKDGSVKIIEKHSSVITKWISEPDQGIYDAWNKGLQLASGDWVMFIGADDILLPNALRDYSTFLSKLPRHKTFDLVSSRLQMFDANGKIVRTKGWPWEWPKFLKEVTIAHPGALHSMQLFKEYGTFNIDYKIVGDFELLLRPKEALRTAFMNIITVQMSEGGASDSVDSIREHFKATTITGGMPVSLALINAVNVYTKFKIKKIARKLGFNLYLKRS